MLNEHIFIFVDINTKTMTWQVQDVVWYQIITSQHRNFIFLHYLQDEVFAFLTKFSGKKMNEEDDDGRVSPTTTVNTWLWKSAKEDEKSGILVSKWILYSLVRARVANWSSSFRKQLVAKSTVSEALFSSERACSKISCIHFQDTTDFATGCILKLQL